MLQCTYLYKKKTCPSLIQPNMLCPSSILQSSLRIIGVLAPPDSSISNERIIENEQHTIATATLLHLNIRL